MGEYKINNVIEVDKKSKKKKKLKTLTSYNFKTGILEACYLDIFNIIFNTILFNSYKFIKDKKRNI